MWFTDYCRWLIKHIKKPDRYQELKEIELLKDLNSFQLYQLDSYINKRTYKAGETLFEHDYPLGVIFCIQSGEVELSGSENKILQSGAVIGIVDIFLKEYRSCTAKAITEVCALTISRDELESLITKHKSLGISLLKASCRHLSKLYQKKENT